MTSASAVRDPAGDRPARRPRRPPPAGRLRARDGVRDDPVAVAAVVRRRPGRVAPRRRPRRRADGSPAHAAVIAAIVARGRGPRSGRGRRRAARRRRPSRRRSRPAPRGSSSAPRRSATRLRGAARRDATEPSGSPSRSMSATAAPSVRAGRPTRSGVDAVETRSTPRRRRRRDVRGDRHRARRPARAGPTSRSTSASSGSARRDHRVGRRRDARATSGGPGPRLHGRDRRPGALRGPIGPARAIALVGCAVTHDVNAAWPSPIDGADTGDCDRRQERDYAIAAEPRHGRVPRPRRLSGRRRARRPPRPPCGAPR